jgi:hypothetical protein
MKDTHLSELEIQEFVLNRSDSQADTLAHLQTCGHCRATAEQYRLLFTGIEDQVKPEFDFDLSELVLASVSTTKPPFKWTNSVVYGLSALGLFFIVLVLILFKENVSVIFNGFKKMTLYLLLATTLVIAGFLALELYKGYIKKMQALKFY